MYRKCFRRREYLLGSFPVYLLPGILAGASALINNSWLMTARADAGAGMEMQVYKLPILIQFGRW